MSIYGVESNDAKPEKKPTISQFIKRGRKPKTNLRITVELCWLPGKFDNFTLVTGRFRVIITPKHPLFNGVQSFFADSNNAEKGIGVEITDWDRGSYMLYEPKERGMWQELGNSGYRWVQDEF